MTHLQMIYHFLTEKEDS